ncbi:MAG: hypothetical protein NC403_01505 [Muribaculaceae bacterium]|nr:hypothetical protein [Muribaculaceae bacterium]
MKKALIGLLVACVGCSDNEPEVYDGVLDNGLYSYYGAEYIVTIGTDYKDGWNYETNCEPGYISITDTKTGEYVYSQINGISSVVLEYNKENHTKTYSGWGYDNGLILLCAPSSNTTFTGIAVKQSPDIELPGEMNFRKIK